MSAIALMRIKLHYGKVAEFGSAMARMKPIVEDQGWRMLHSFYTVIGDALEVYDIWELPSADAMGSALAAAEADPRYAEIGPIFDAIVASETQSIVEPFPFSP